MFDTFKEIWQTLSTNRLRTMLTGLSVAWGIFMLIILLSISNGVINSSRSWQSKDDQFRLSVWGGRTTVPYQGLQDGRNIQLRDRNVQAINASGSDIITDATAKHSFTANISTPNDYLASKRIYAVNPTDFNGRFTLVAGRFINDADLRALRKVIVLKDENAEQLFKSTDQAIGRTVNINGLAFTVVGVYSHAWESNAFIPYTTGRAISGYTDNVVEINVNLSHDITTVEQSEQAAKTVREVVGRQEQFEPTDENALWMNNRFEQMVRSVAALNILSITMWVIGLLTLVTGIVGVSNIMFVSVRERTHEIGIRRALGAPPRSILMQVILESITLTTVFGYIGIVLGTIVTEVLKMVFKDSDFMLNPSVDISIAIEVTIVLVVCGALAGFFPARRALKVKPVEALREE